MKRILIPVFCMLAVSFAFAQASVPNNFSSSQTISASAMNDNFTALVNAITALQTRVTALESTTAVDSSVTTVGSYAVVNGAQKTGTVAGYLTLHGGVIIEWGTVTQSSNSSGLTTTVTLPKAFPTGLLYANASCGFGINADSAYFTDLANSSNTKVAFMRRNPSNSSSGVDFTWIAVGY